MGYVYSLSWYNVETGAVVGTYRTLAGLKMANTAGNRGRVLMVTVCPAAEAPQDINVTFRLTTTDNTGDGTSTAATVKKLDANNPTSLVNAAGLDYTAEPTTVASQHFYEAAINGRGGIIVPFYSMPQQPVFGHNQSLILQASPGTATAVITCGTIVWEE